MSSKRQSPGVPEARETLRNRAPELDVFIELSEPFCVWDAVERGVDRDEYNRVMSLLKQLGVLEHVGYRRRYYSYESDDGSRIIHDDKRVYEYEWIQEYKEYVKDIIAQTSTLPCGHRAHILNKGDGEYGCQYCDEERSYTRKTVARCLD